MFAKIKYAKFSAIRGKKVKVFRRLLDQMFRTRRQPPAEDIPCLVVSV